MPAGARVLVVDDVLATGGTAAAACALVQRLGGTVVGAGFLMELPSLAGRTVLRAAAGADVPVVSCSRCPRAEASAPARPGRAPVPFRSGLRAVGSCRPLVRARRPPADRNRR